MTNKLLVPFSRNMREYALIIESCFERMNMDSSEFSIAAISVSSFIELLRLNEIDRTVVAVGTSTFFHVSFDTIRDHMYEKPIDHWELTDFPEDFIDICEEIVHRCDVNVVEDAILLSIGYFATLIKFIEDGKSLLISESINGDLGLRDFTDQILDSYHPGILQ